MNGQKLRVALAIIGWTQTKLAKETGLSQSFISRLCRDQENPSVKTIKLIAYALEIEPEELTDEEDPSAEAA